MVRKFTLLLAAVAVLAFAAPALANASSITSSAGKLTPVGTAITATGSDFTQTSNLLGSITCEKLNVKFTLTKNSGSAFEGSGTSEKPAQSGCRNGEKTLIYTSFDITNIASTTSGSGTLSFTAVEDIGTITCTVTGTAIPFTYTPGTSAIKFASAGPVTSKPAACGTEKIDASFALEIGSTPVILD
jgi:hypothetical protein